MIDIRYTEGEITLSGHAHYAESGKDIVCAGISALVQSLIQSIEELTQDKIQYSMSPGRVDIKFRDLSEQAQLLVSSFFVGVKQIADNYPKHVKLTKP